MINKNQLLTQLISEIEQVIEEDNTNSYESSNNLKKEVLWSIDHKALLINGHISIDLINELGFLIQTYGSELLHYIDIHCPPMSIPVAMSTFIMEKEKHKVKALKNKLNPYIDIEDIITYRFADYLTLGYPFFDSLFYVYFYSYETNKHNAWGLVSCHEYEKPSFLNQVTNTKHSKSPIKNMIKNNI